MHVGGWEATTSNQLLFRIVSQGIRQRGKYFLSISNRVRLLPLRLVIQSCIVHMARTRPMYRNLVALLKQPGTCCAYILCREVCRRVLWLGNPSRWRQFGSCSGTAIGQQQGLGTRIREHPLDNRSTKRKLKHADCVRSNSWDTVEPWRLEGSCCAFQSLEAWKKLYEQGQLDNACQVWDLMDHSGIVVSKDMFYRLLKTCVAKGHLELGRKVHSLIVKSEYALDNYLGNHLIRMYASQNSLMEANEVFRKLPAPNSFVWASIISAHSDLGQPEQAIQLYHRVRSLSMKLPDILFVAVLRACTMACDLTAGKQVHSDLMDKGFEANIFVGNTLLHFYVQCGSLEDAHRLFDRLPSRDVVTWTAMIAGYVRLGFGHEALALHKKMSDDGVIPDAFTFVSLLKACGKVGALCEGKQLHAQIIDRGLESDVFIGNILVDMYAKCGSLDDALNVFEGLSRRDVVTWTALVVGYAQEGLVRKALELYARMMQDGVMPDNVVFVSTLKACGMIGAVQEGQLIHSQIIERGLYVDIGVLNTLVDMYAKCGSLGEAYKVFNDMLVKDAVTWTAMIAGYSQHGFGREALNLYMQMEATGLTPENATFASILTACGSIGAIQQGMRIHAQILKIGLQTDICVGNALVDMYVKCGRLEEARNVFDRLPAKDVVTWNALLNGYGHHSMCTMAFESFVEMLQQGVEPDAATFLSLLVACSHVGLVEDGQRYFRMMEEQHGIRPTIEHYICLVDLLGRSGHLHEAESLMLTMPYAPVSVGWRSLLSACKTYGNVEIGLRCFDRLRQIDPQHGAAYALMGNSYAAAGRLDAMYDVDQLRKSAGVQKRPAKALLEVNKKVHEFVVGDRNFADSYDTYAKLRELSTEMKGCAPPANLFVGRVDDEDALCGHAEKLAIGFGLLNTPEGTPLLVIKDLRMCNHCHDGTKFISRSVKREIIVRDGHRVHCFKDGSCSCGDYP